MTRTATLLAVLLMWAVFASLADAGSVPSLGGDIVAMMVKGLNPSYSLVTVGYQTPAITPRCRTCPCYGLTFARR
jgi:hypothetical protein